MTTNHAKVYLNSVMAKTCNLLRNNIINKSLYYLFFYDIEAKDLIDNLFTYKVYYYSDSAEKGVILRACGANEFSVSYLQLIKESVRILDNSLPLLGPETSGKVVFSFIVQ